MAKGRVPGGGMITPAQMMQQWKNAPHRFDLNLNNFEVRIGRAAEAIFKKSFEMHRFNTASAARPMRTYGKTGVKSIQRQFIGHSSYLEDEFKQLAISTLFNGFPK